VRLGFLIFVFAASCATAISAQDSACKKEEVFATQGVKTWSTSGEVDAFLYEAGMAIDADGAARAYHRIDRRGLDWLAHAGSAGNWWALVTDNGKRDGRPVVQGRHDPAPGYYVSTTALYDTDNPNRRDPHRYVDASKIPYVVLHPKALKHARLGDFATVVNLQNGRVAAALAADESAPNLPVGEGSIALAKELGINASPRHGGKDAGVVYIVYSGSGNGRPRPLEEIRMRAGALFKAWGGMEKLNGCLTEN